MYKRQGEHYLIWGDLGGNSKHPKYKVKEAYRGLHLARFEPELGVNNWKTVNEYIDLIEKGDIELKITVTSIMADNTPIDAIIDGCKRTTAFYEYNKSRGVEDIEFNLMILKY